MCRDDLNQPQLRVETTVDAYGTQMALHDLSRSFLATNQESSYTNAVTKLAKRTGRPRGFNYEEALASAMKVFWRKGFEGPL